MKTYGFEVSHGYEVLKGVVDANSKEDAKTKILKEEWEDITGYSAESWHIRYVGVKAASVIQKENITYEEYYAKYILTKKSSK